MKTLNSRLERKITPNVFEKTFIISDLKFVTFWTTIIFTFRFNVNRISNGEAFVQNSCRQEQYEKLFVLHCCRGNSNVLVGLTSLNKVIAQAENNTTIENQINAMLCGKWIVGNFTHQMETAENNKQQSQLILRTFLHHMGLCICTSPVSFQLPCSCDDFCYSGYFTYKNYYLRCKGCIKVLM